MGKVDINGKNISKHEHANSPPCHWDLTTDGGIGYTVNDYGLVCYRFCIGKLSGSRWQCGIMGTEGT